MITAQDLTIIELYHQCRSFKTVANELSLTEGRVRHRYFRAWRWFEEMFNGEEVVDNDDKDY